MTYLRPREATRHWPHDGEPPHPRKIVRAITQGTPSKGSPGLWIKLKAIHNTRSWLTSEEWIADYLAAVTADRQGSATPTVTDRARRAGAVLQASGW